MNPSDCTREAEILDAITVGRWAHSTELRAHASTCATCADLVTVASAITEDVAAAMRRAPIPGSGLIWWRMQRRVQLEAARNVKRAVTFVEALTLAATAFAVLFILGGLSLLKFDWRVLPWNVPLLAAAAMILALAPFAVYYAVTEE
jgi:plasmid maintenance system antidote protein VapI